MSVIEIIEILLFVLSIIQKKKKKESDDATKSSTFYSNWNPEAIINESVIHNLFESIYCTIISNIQKFLGKGFGWIIYSIFNDTINISKYNPFSCSIADTNHQ